MENSLVDVIFFWEVSLSYVKADKKHVLLIIKITFSQVHQSGELEKLLVNHSIIPEEVEDAGGSSS